jgi:tRNA-binding protein
MAPISWQDFEKIDIRVGRVERAEVFEGARKPAYKLWIDFGPEIGILRSSAQVTVHYQPEDLEGRTIVAIVNFPPNQLATFFSECLVLGVYDDQKNVVLLAPDKPVASGHKIG